MDGVVIERGGSAAFPDHAVHEPDARREPVLAKHARLVLPDTRLVRLEGRDRDRLESHAAIEKPIDGAQRKKPDVGPDVDDLQRRALLTRDAEARESA